MTTQAVTVTGGALIFATFAEEIKGCLIKIYNYITDYFYETRIIDIKRAPRTAHAIRMILQEMIGDTKPRSNVFDGSTVPMFELVNGTYKINTNMIKNKNIEKTECVGKISIYIGDDTIELSRFTLTKKTPNLSTFITAVYKLYSGPINAKIIYSVKESNWNIPTVSKPILIKESQYSKEMKLVIDDVNNFKKSEKLYAKENEVYRRGYLIYGPPGTGKTATVEIISTLHNMAIYNLILESLTDSSLISLLASVPRNSIIIVDEFDKQMEQILRNERKMLSTAGILSSFDGIHRLSHGSIIVITANKIDKFNDIFGGSLIRHGRIDMVTPYTTVYSK